jgi:hypothetical protein
MADLELTPSNLVGEVDGIPVELTRTACCPQHPPRWRVEVTASNKLHFTVDAADLETAKDRAVGLAGKLAAYVELEKRAIKAREEIEALAREPQADRPFHDEPPF